MKKFLTGFLFLIAFIVFLVFSTISTAEQTANNTEIISINIKYLGIDKNLSAEKSFVNITMNRSGNLTYMEEYYMVDNHGNLKLDSSNRYYDGVITNNTVSFEISRARSKPEKMYSSIKGIVVFNNSTVFAAWLPMNKSYKSSSVAKSIKSSARSSVQSTTAISSSIKSIFDPPVTYMINKKDFSKKVTTMGLIYWIITITVILSFVYLYIKNK